MKTRRGRLCTALAGAIGLVGADLGADPAEATVALVSVRASFDSGSGATAPLLSADGKVVALQSAAIDLVEGSIPIVTHSTADVFAFRLADGVGHLVSKAAGGSAAGGNATSTTGGLSADGRFVVFTSGASNLVATTDTNREDDVFVRDTLQGTTALVSVAAAGGHSGGRGSAAPSITPDGRFVVFLSRAADLVAGVSDGNSADDVFVRDLMLQTTTLVSVNAAGTAPGNAACERPRISDDGRFVVFASAASDLVAPGIDTNGKRDVFVRDLTLQTTTLVSTESTGAVSADGDSFGPLVSADGKRVAFESDAGDLIGAGVDGNGVDDVYVFDRTTGDAQLASANPSGHAGDAPSLLRGFSADARTVLFSSSADDLASGDGNGAPDVFVRDLVAGATTLVSVNAAGTAAAAGASRNPVMTPDGAVVAFESGAGDLVAGFTDRNGDGNDVFVRRLSAHTTQLVSQNRNGTGGGNGDSSAPTLAADGSVVAFASDACDLAGSAAGIGDVYVRDLDAGVTRLISAGSGARKSANGLSGGGAMTPDGRYVLFDSSASDLVADGVDENGVTDLFRRDRTTGITTLVSVAASGVHSGNSFSNQILFHPPRLTPDGRFVLFASAATDLVANFVDGNGANVSDLFLRDTQIGTTRLVTQNAAGTASAGGFSEPLGLSDDGRFVLFASAAADLVPGFVDGNGNQFPTSDEDLFVRDMASGTTELVSTSVVANVSGNARTRFGLLSADGRKVVFESGATNLVGGIDSNAGEYDIFVRDLAAKTTAVVSVSTQGNRTADQESTLSSMSPDGRFVSFFSFASDLVPGFVDGNGFVADVFLRDVAQGQTQLISVNAAGTASGNDLTQASVVTPNGRFVAFESLASDLVAGLADNGVGNVFRRDVQTGQTAFIDVNRLGDGSANGSADGIGISNDGRFAAFASSGTNVVANISGNQLYWRDLDLGQTKLVTRSIVDGKGSKTMAQGLGFSGDGQILAFLSAGSDLVDGDLNLGTDVFVFEPSDAPAATPTPTRTRTPAATTLTPTPTATPTVAASEMTGDCDGNHRVTIEELVRAVAVSKQLLPSSACSAADADDNGSIGVDELRDAVSNALAS